jgi:hypothetical protein
MGTAESSTPAAGIERLVERRMHRRFRPRRRLTCEACLPGEEPASGQVQDLSAGGMAFFCERGWRSGQILKVRMLAPSGVYCLHAEFRVIRSVKVQAGPWVVAGAFVQTLSPEELGPFIIG